MSLEGQNMIMNTAIALIIGAGVIGAGLPAYAESSDEAGEVLAMQAAKLTAQDAIQAATAKVPGKISSVQVYNDAGTPAFHVEIQGENGQQQDLSVNAVSGEVMKMASDFNDREDGDHEDDREGSETQD